jgi:hypothetical protein
MIPELKKTTEHKMQRSIEALKRISPRCAPAVPTPAFWIT